MNRLIASKVLAISVGLLCVLLAYNHNKSSTYEIGGSIYGTYWKLVSTDYISDSIKQSIVVELDRIDLIASNYKIQSELSILNKAPANTKIKISKDLYNLLSLAEDLNKVSEGAYDVTLGSMVINGGFGPEATITSYDLKANKRFVISEDLYLEKYNQFLFDLSSIAKGYAVDSIHDLLIASNRPNFLLDIGGELIVSGSKHGSPWIIGIQDPIEFTNQAITNIATDSFLAVATSGEYRNTNINDAGEIISHTFNPINEESLLDKSYSVTVASEESSMRADAWATALNVLGPDRGIKLANSNSVSAMYLIEKDNIIMKSKYWNYSD